MSAAVARPIREDATLQPFSEDAEEAVLSAMLMDAAAIDRACEFVDANTFYIERHQRIFRAILSIHQRACKVDPLTLSHELQRKGELDAAGGKDYIGYLVDAVPTAANIEYHAGIVADASRRRALAGRLANDLHAARSGERNAVQIVHDLRAALDMLAISPREGGLVLLDDEQILQLPPLEFLVQDIVPSGGACAMYGPPGIGKSFLALEFALCVAAGVPFFGHAVQASPVVYIAAEGSAGLPNRVSAWKRHRRAAGRLGVQFMTEPVHLLEARSVSRFLSAIRVGGTVPGLVVVDTLARCMAGGDENSAQDMGIAIGAVDRIRRETGAAVFVVHHTRKDGDSERGSTALRGAMDAMIALKGEEGELSFTCEKMKDAAPFGPIRLTLASEGESCVLITAKNEWQSSGANLREKHLDCLRSLSRDFLAEGATLPEWMKATGLPERTFFRIRSDLVAWGYVHFPGSKRGARYTLTEQGQQAITAAAISLPTSLSVSDDRSLPATGAFLESPVRGSHGSHQT